jgi:hypothetical protein
MGGQTHTLKKTIWVSAWVGEGGGGVGTWEGWRRKISKNGIVPFFSINGGRDLRKIEEWQRCCLGRCLGGEDDWFVPQCVYTSLHGCGLCHPSMGLYFFWERWFKLSGTLALVYEQ